MLEATVVLQNVRLVARHLEIREYSMKTSMLLISTLIFAAISINGPAVSADAAKGKKVFRKCVACHTLDTSGKNRIGPNLYGVVGKPIGNVKGYRYSKSYPAAGAKGVTWTVGSLEEYLINPRKFIKKVTGNSAARSKMVFRLSKKSERQNVVEYLKSRK
jgi:cytochrome c